MTCEFSSNAGYDKEKCAVSKEKELAPSHYDPLPHYDRGLKTKKLVFLGLFVTLPLAIFIFGWGIIGVSKDTTKYYDTGARHCLSGDTVTSPIRSWNFYRVPRLYIATSIVATAIVAVFEICIGYAHSVSLRWCLWHERRLEYNTNSRFLTCSRISWPNGRLINTMYLLAVAASYAASSQLTYIGYIMHFNGKGLVERGAGIAFNSMALSFLGAGLLTQTTLSLMAVYSARKMIKTWSSDALNCALAKLQSDIDREEKRWPLSAADSIIQPLSLPTARQRPMNQAVRSINVFLTILWIASLITLIWGAIATIDIIPRKQVFLAGKNPFVTILESYQAIYPGASRDMLPDRAYTNINLTKFKPRVSSFLGFLIYTAVQSYITFALHCAEVIVSTTRDEKSWQRTTSGKGSFIGYSSIKLALASWENIALFVLKVACHFAFGQCLAFSTTGNSLRSSCRGGRLIFTWSTIWLLAAFNVILALIFTLRARRHPRGPQPPTWGHHQTIVSLIDNWGELGKPLYWGDKGTIRANVVNVRHAGTANYPLGKIHMNAYYTGVGNAWHSSSRGQLDEVGSRQQICTLP